MKTGDKRIRSTICHGCLQAGPSVRRAYTMVYFKVSQNFNGTLAIRRIVMVYFQSSRIVMAPFQKTLSANISAQQTDEPLADEGKDRLQDMLGYLEKDVVDLVRDAEPIRSAFRAIKDQLSPELFSALSPAAYIKGHESKIVQAKKRLADRLTYQQLAEQKNFKKPEVIELKQKLEDLKKTPAQIDETINRLKVEESRLEGLLVRVRAAIHSEEQKKAEVPELISKAVEEMKTKAQQLQAVYKEIKPDSGTADENIQVIKEVNEIRLRAVKMIRDALCL